MSLRHLNRAVLCFAPALIGTLFTLSTAVASPLTGLLQVSGSVQVSATSIDFLPLGPPNGNLQLQNAGNTVSFIPLNGAVSHIVSILDLNGGPQTGAVSIPNFITIAGTGTVLDGSHFDLTYISPGSDPSDVTTNCNALLAGYVGETCSPPNSPFNLQDVTTNGSAPGSPCNGGCGSLVSFNVSGRLVSPTGEISAFSGLFTTQFTAPETYQQILATLEAGGSVNVGSYSGTITASAVPEPGTLMMLFAGTGMLAIGIFSKKYRSSRR